MTGRPSLLASVVEPVVNRVLRLDPESLQRLAQLQGKIIRVDFGSGRILDIEPTAEGLRIRRGPHGDDPVIDSEREPDVTLRGSIPLFARLARTGVAAGELQISGDVDLGSRFKRILEDIDLDWEEPLARLVGDVAAHQIARAIRAARRWGQSAVRSLSLDVAEYFQEESRLLAPRPRVDEFLSAVDRLRADADRLDERLRRLEAKAR